MNHLFDDRPSCGPGSDPAVGPRDDNAAIPALDRQPTRPRGLNLQGEAAKTVSGDLAKAAGRSLLSREGLYELVPSRELRTGMGKGLLEAATPFSGDASVLVKEVGTGKISGHQDLTKAKPGVLGPAAWQAMALATQQHYLAEISGQLEGLRDGLDEVLARLDDDRIGTLNHLSEEARDIRAALARDEEVSSERLSGMRSSAGTAKETWHGIAATARRKLDGYGGGRTTAYDVGQSFVMLMRATQVLAECSQALLAAPHQTVDELRLAAAQERDRLYPALPWVRQYAEELIATSKGWNQQEVAFRFSRSRNPVRRGMRSVTQRAPKKPAQASLDGRLFWHCGMVAAQRPTAPAAMLIECAADGTVEVLVERGAPSGHETRGPDLADVECSVELRGRMTRPKGEGSYESARETPDG